MPLLVIKEGVINADVVDEEYEQAKQEVANVLSNAQSVHQDPLRYFNGGKEQEEEVCSTDSRGSGRSIKQGPLSTSTPKVEAVGEESRARAQSVFQIRRNRKDSGRNSSRMESENKTHEPGQYDAEEEADNEGDQIWSDTDSGEEY
ncbi:hypothetical protein ABVT39_022997 [Epinephelus coioides]